MGKSTINGHFQYQTVKLPEGNLFSIIVIPIKQQEILWIDIPTNGSVGNGGFAGLPTNIYIYIYLFHL
jgi:hypothetical protein